MTDHTSSTRSRTYVFAYARTAFGRFQGSLSGYTAAELGAIAIDETLNRANVSPTAIDGVYLGTGLLGGYGLTAARQAVLLSELPQTTPSVGIDRACCSGLSAIALANNEAILNPESLIVCGGMESLSQAPYLLPRNIRKLGDITAEDPLLLRAPLVDSAIAKYTSEEAERMGVSRSDQDTWALQSHDRYFSANAKGHFDRERFSVTTRKFNTKQDNALLSADESPRNNSSLEKLASLQPVRGSLSITAGNAPGLNDGSACLLIGGEEVEKVHGLQAVAEIVGTIRIADGPKSGTRTPALAIQKLLQKHGLQLKQLDVIEINEAFAATALASTMILADFDNDRTEEIRQITNANGGAVAIGHPFGASGPRLLMTAISALQSRGGGYGVASICGGYGQGEAVLIKV